MALPRLVTGCYATPGDYVWHLGPRPIDGPDGSLTLCGLHLEPMRPVADPASAPGLVRECAMCGELTNPTRWADLPASSHRRPRSSRRARARS